MMTGGGSQSSSPKSSPQRSPSVSNPTQCQKCTKTVAKSKPALKCNCCHLLTNTTCLPDWTDVTSNAELSKITTISGLIWYCDKCQPTLTDYFHGPRIKPAIEELDEKIDSMTRLVGESHKITKTYAQATVESNDNNAEIMAIAQRLDVRTKKEIQTRESLERKQSAILHYLPENVNTHQEVGSILQSVKFHPNSTTSISRLGTFKQTGPQSKPRPVKIRFHTAVIKIDFLRIFNTRDNKDILFATPDLSKEEQEKEFKLRQARNDLTSKFKENRYRVRNGRIQCFPKERGATLKTVSVSL